MVNRELLEQTLARARAFEAEAHDILGLEEEAAQARVFRLRSSYASLAPLSEWQRKLFNEALDCIGAGMYRAAHVLAWAAFADFLEQKLASDGLKKVAAAYPKWDTSSLEALRESTNEHQLIEAGRKVGLFSRSPCKTLQGLLSIRNECAHPSDYEPELNDSLGYLTQLRGRIAFLQPKSL